MEIGERELLTILVYVVIGALSLALALGLGKRDPARFTWVSVVVGTALTVAPLGAIMPLGEWAKVWGAFVVAGLFQIARCLILDWQRDARTEREIRDR